MRESGLHSGSGVHFASKKKVFLSLSLSSHAVKAARGHCTLCYYIHGFSFAIVEREAYHICVCRQAPNTDLLTLTSPQERRQKKLAAYQPALYQHARHEIVHGGAVVLWSEV